MCGEKIGAHFQKRSDLGWKALMAFSLTISRLLLMLSSLEI